MERFEALYAAHEDWDVEVYSMCTFKRDVWIFKYAFPVATLKMINKAKRTMKDYPELLKNKMKALNKRYRDLLIDGHKLKPIEDEKAAKIVRMCS